MKSALLALSLAIATGTAMAETVTQPAGSAPVQALSPEKQAVSNQPAINKPVSNDGYLGVFLAPIPDAVRAQLGNKLPLGQGVMVMQVMPGSPADQAGLEPFDILVYLDDQKLFTTDQVAQLVRAEGADKAVNFAVLHGGMPLDMQIVLAGSPITSEPVMHPAMPRRGLMPPAVPLGKPAETQMDSWQSFSSMSMKKLDDGKLQVDIAYLDKDGKTVNKSFTGTPDEVRQQIDKQDDLPPAERKQLLDAMYGRDHMMMPDMGITVPWMNPPDMPHWFMWHQGY